jgi:hypothetical protein
MKYLLILLMICGVAYAQEPPYTPMKGNYRFKGIKVDSLFLIPSFADTTAANATNLDSVAGAFIRTGNDFWMRNAELTSWLQNVNIGPGSSPVGLSLQNVLDNNHDLVNGNNFQGTNAGVGSSARSDIIAIGEDAGTNVVGDNNTFIGNNAGQSSIGSNNIAIGGTTLNGTVYDLSYGVAIGNNALRSTNQDNIVLDIVAIGNYAGMDLYSGSYINAIGSYAFNGGRGYQINAIGNLAAYTNTGDYVNAIGLSSATGNGGSDVNALGSGTAGSNSGNNINALGYAAASNNTGDNVNALGRNAGDSNTASNVNALGYNAGYHNVYSHVTLLGNTSTATADKQLVLSDSTFSTRINYEVQGSSREYTIPPQVEGTFKVTNYYEPDLNSADYYAVNPGFYLLTNGSGYDLIFPDPDKMTGQTITVYNKTASSIDFNIGCCDIINEDGSSVTSIPIETVYTFIAAQTFWLKTN